MARSRTSGEYRLGRAMGSILSRNEPSDEPGTIQTGRIHEQLRGLRELLWRALRADLVIVVSILLIICGASWGLLRWQLTRVQHLLETQETLQLEIAQTQTALDQLQAETWGVWLHEESDGMRYVVLPMGTLEVEGWPWTVQGQPAVLLSSE